MEARMVLDAILARTQDSGASVLEAPHSIGRTAEYRGKVYLALLHLESERVSVARPKPISAREKQLKAQALSAASDSPIQELVVPRS